MSFESEVEGHMEGGFESLSLYTTLRECLDCGIVNIRPDGRIQNLSAPAERILHRSASEVVGHSLSVLPEALGSLVQEAIVAGADISGRDLLIPHESGSTPVRASITLAHDVNGAPLELTVVLHDLTAARKLDQSMRWLDRLASIGTLSASMAHEVKNAMVSVRTFAGLLLRMNKDADLAGLVGREINRIDSIVSQMLRFAGPAKPTFTPVHLHEILNRSLALVEHQVNGKKVEITCALLATNDLISGDAYQLEQAFINLFFNALEAMGPGGRLAVTTQVVTADDSNASAVIRVQVSDTGVGIAAADLDRLFQPFFTTKVEGTGLGLPITRRIVVEHRGTITVQSELNRGSTFTVELPVIEH